MATPLNNRAESKIEAATLADKKVELKHTDLVKMLFIAISQHIVQDLELQVSAMILNFKIITLCVPPTPPDFLKCLYYIMALDSDDVYINNICHNN